LGRIVESGAEMDEQENAHLKQQIRELDRARRLWKATALSLLAAGIALLVLGGMGGLAMHGFLQTKSAMQAERAAMVEAQMQADRARAAEMAVRAEAEKHEKDRAK
jgi:hypothetical protein